MTTEYARPDELVVFWRERDANPFFHLMEGLWMLSGSDDVAFLRQYNGRIAEVASDDGVIFHGAYGRRWRSHFGRDQLEKIARILGKNQDDRRAVLQMWDPQVDLGRDGKDVPCNLTCHFQINLVGNLDLTVFCRSNDVVWGCYGSDSVDFGMLLSFMAAWLRTGVGRYWQVSSNWHGYPDTIVQLGEYPDPYAAVRVLPHTLVTGTAENWLDDLGFFLAGDIDLCRDQFFHQIAWPMKEAWASYKQKKFEMAYIWLSEMPKKNDWRKAAWEWVQRREERWLESQKS